MNTTTIARLFDQGVGKAASAHMIQNAAAAYKDRGYKCVTCVLLCWARYWLSQVLLWRPAQSWWRGCLYRNRRGCAREVVSRSGWGKSTGTLAADIRLGCGIQGLCRCLNFGVWTDSESSFTSREFEIIELTMIRGLPSSVALSMRNISEKSMVEDMNISYSPPHETNVERMIRPDRAMIGWCRSPAD